MKQLLIHILRSRWLIVGVNVGLWLLICLAAMNLGGKAPPYNEAEASSTPLQPMPPVGKLAPLLGPGVWPNRILNTNSLSPFFTRHFIPPPAPAAPAPTTRKIELTFQGFFETDNGPKQTIVKLGDAYIVGMPGSKLTANLFISDVSMQVLTLTNLASQTNILLLNTKKEMEVPLQ
jgi:hypothetical protein